MCQPPPLPCPSGLLTSIAQAAPLTWPPPLHPPSCLAHPISVPLPFSHKRGCKWGSVHPPPTCAQSPALPCPTSCSCEVLSPVSPCPLPCLTLPHPACPHLCTHAGGAEGTVCHPLLSIRGQQSPLPGLHLTPPTCPPPPLHACWGQGRQSVPLLFPICEQASLPGLLPLSPPAYTPPAACTLPHPLHECWGRAGGTVHTPPSIHPSTQAMPPLPPGLRPTPPHPAPPTPLHLGCASPPPSIYVPHHICTSFCAHSGSAGGTGVHARGGPHRGGHAQGGHTPREACTQGDHAQGEGAWNDGWCNLGSEGWRCEGCVSGAMHNLGEGPCTQVEWGCKYKVEGFGVPPGAGKEEGCASTTRWGAAHEWKAVCTISAPLHQRST